MLGTEKLQELNDEEIIDEVKKDNKTEEKKESKKDNVKYMYKNVNGKKIKLQYNEKIYNANKKNGWTL